MNELEFRKWLSKEGLTKKVQSDYISRLKRVEHELNQCDIEEQYHTDKCEHIMAVFLNMGNNDEMKKYPNANLPIGKYYMSTLRLAIRKYIQFSNEMLISKSQ